MKILLPLVLLVGLNVSAMMVAPQPQWSSYEFVFAGKLDTVNAGPVGRSYPPMYTHTLNFTVEKVLRGNLKPGEKVTFSNIARQEAPPVFPEGKSCLVAGESTFSGRTIRQIVPADAADVEAVATACRLPVGWRVESGKIVSPWASLGFGAWPKTAGNPGAKDICAITGRPALLCGDGVEFSIAPVPPEKSIRYQNPDGDGQYALSVKNITDKPIEVPALLTDGKEILWDNSVVILCQNRAYPLPGYRKNLQTVKPATLQPGQSVSGVVIPLALEGPDWPRGGYRIRFQFCLGEKSVSHEFYYFSKHHDAIRQKLISATPGFITWDEMKSLILTGKVSSVMQTHARKVTVTMENGTKYHATSPQLDDVIKFIRETGKGSIPIATE